MLTRSCSYCWGRNIENQCGSSVSAYVPAAEPLLVPGVADAKVVKCGFLSTCASTGAGAQHKLVCWGNKLGSRAQGYPTINPSIVWPSPTVFPLYNDKPLKEGEDSFSIGSYSGCTKTHTSPMLSNYRFLNCVCRMCCSRRQLVILHIVVLG
jgi:hypothetical protein